MRPNQNQTKEYRNRIEIDQFFVIKAETESNGKKVKSHRQKLKMLIRNDFVICWCIDQFCLYLIISFYSFRALKEEISSYWQKSNVLQQKHQQFPKQRYLVCCQQHICCFHWMTQLKIIYLNSSVFFRSIFVQKSL